MGDLDDELRRMFADDRLEVPVRTGAEWSLVAGARRRRKRQTTLAAVGGVLAMGVLFGGGAVLVARPDPGPVRPAVPPVVGTSVPSPVQPPIPLPTSPPVPADPAPGGGWVPRWSPPERGDPAEDAEDERLSILRQVTSEPESTSAEPSEPSEPQPTSEPTEPSTEPSDPG
ncbi:hypothetical protein [Saccharopolyspora gregorii]|uniref:hypothetical protein n=1 Tax=Saccharopolyspora gregorii TaxID=33914 RepID=UPI0021AD4024|nr:hypothetical protein [Saccharopolyspora gregorii]